MSHAAASFGVSRPTWYQAQRGLRSGRAAGDCCRTGRDPRRPHKLTDEVVEALRGGEGRTAGPDRRRYGRAGAGNASASRCIAAASARALGRAKKNSMTRRSPCAALATAELSAYGHGYERMRRHAVEPGVVHDRHGLAVVALRGVAALAARLLRVARPAGGPCAATRRRSRCPPTWRSRSSTYCSRCWAATWRGVGHEAPFIGR